jgi:selenophosphate synthetase-related protein
MGERVRLSDVKVDVENAFKQWLDRFFDSIGPDGMDDDDFKAESEINAAYARVTAFLAQVEEEIGSLELENRELKAEVADLVKEVQDLREQLSDTATD